MSVESTANNNGPVVESGYSNGRSKLRDLACVTLGAALAAGLYLGGRAAWADPDLAGGITVTTALGKSNELDFFVRDIDSAAGSGEGSIAAGTIVCNGRDARLDLVTVADDQIKPEQIEAFKEAVDSRICHGSTVPDTRRSGIIVAMAFQESGIGAAVLQQWYLDPK